jgi:hypothetical protein
MKDNTDVIRIEHLTGLLLEAQRKIKAQEKEIKVLKSFAGTENGSVNVTADDNELHHVLVTRTKTVIELSKRINELQNENEQLKADNLRISNELKIRDVEIDKMHSRMRNNESFDAGVLGNMLGIDTSSDKGSSMINNLSIKSHQFKPMLYKSGSKQILSDISPSNKTWTSDIPRKEVFLQGNITPLSENIRKEQLELESLQREKQLIEEELLNRYAELRKVSTGNLSSINN